MLFILTLYLATGAEIVQSPLPLFDEQDNGPYVSSSLRYDSLNLSFVGNWPFGCSFVTTHDMMHNNCYLSSGGGVYIIDMADPTNPQEINRFHTKTGTIYGLVYENGLLYMSDRSYGFQIWDVQDAYNPVYLGGCEIYGTLHWGDGAWGIALSLPYAYVVSEDSGLVIIDVSEPADPHEIGRCYLHDQSCNVALSGDYAYVAHATGHELAVIDVADPTNPTYVSGCVVPFIPVDVVISGNIAYVCGAPGDLSIIDITLPSDPVLLSSCNLPTFYHGCRGLTIKDTLAFVAATDSGLYVVNVADPRNPFVLSQTPPYYMTHDVFVVDTCAYTADIDGGLRILNIAEPQSPGEIGAFDAPGSAYSIAIDYPYAYTFDYLSGVYILDISDVQHPEEVGHIENTGWAMAYEGIQDQSFLYTADGMGGLNIQNVSDPLNPVHVSTCSTGFARCAAKKDTCVYVGDRDFPGIRVVNVATPENPQIVYSDTCSSPNYIEVYGNRAYVGSSSWSPKMIIYDISNPAQPIRVGEYNISGNDIVLQDRLAFVAAMDGLTILDISDPAHIQFVSQHAGWYYGVAVQGSYVCAAGHDAQSYVDRFVVDVFDISDIYNPMKVGYYSTPARNNDIVLHDSLVFVSCGACGLQVYTSQLLSVEEYHDDIIVPLFMKVFPNPARASFTVQFTAQCSDKITVTLFDAVGRVADEIYNGCAEIGLNNIPYTNVSLPNGVYFIRLKMNNTTHTEKIILQR